MIGVFIQMNQRSRRGKAQPIGYIICENGCWEWVGCLNSCGYGSLFRDGRVVDAHRFVYEAQRGKVPAELELDHRCRLSGDNLVPWYASRGHRACKTCKRVNAVRAAAKRKAAIA